MKRISMRAMLPFVVCLYDASLARNLEREEGDLKVTPRFYVMDRHFHPEVMKWWCGGLTEKESRQCKGGHVCGLFVTTVDASALGSRGATRIEKDTATETIRLSKGRPEQQAITHS